ncbi:MAG: hypothetical protein E7603_04070 [Ruminococcaceae bacterium]|nr:hypothetical protein [Oscillospiraceae bacterium]
MTRKKLNHDAVSEDNQDETMQQQSDNKKTESSRKTERLNMFIGIFSVVCALMIWLYSSAISETEMKLQSPINVKYVIDVEDKGYDVEYNDKLKISFVVNGKTFAISQIPNYGINVYADLSTVNLSEIITSKTVQLPLIFDLPEGVTCPEKSHEYIEVTIVKKSND